MSCQSLRQLLPNTPEVLSHFQKQLIPLLRLIPEEADKVGTRIPIPSFDAGQIHELIVIVRPILSRDAQAVLELPFPCWVIGDIHGNFHDLIRIISRIDPTGSGRAVFLGDYVDRGSYSLEVLLALLMLKATEPDRFFFLRGNHELASVNAEYGFKEELDERYPESGLWEAFNDLFDLLPLAAILGDSVICLHGGLGPHVSSIDKVKKLSFPISPADLAGIVTEIVWADPTKESIPYVASARGRGYLFGPLALKDFLKASQCTKLLRAHQCVPRGLEPFAYGNGLTIFSTSNYMGQNNCAGIIFIEEDGRISSEEFEPLNNAVARANAQYAPVAPIANSNPAPVRISLSFGRMRSKKDFGDSKEFLPCVRRLGKDSTGALRRGAATPTAILIAAKVPQLSTLPEITLM
jgi:hypothetical protein